MQIPPLLANGHSSLQWDLPSLALLSSDSLLPLSHPPSLLYVSPFPLSHPPHSDSITTIQNGPQIPIHLLCPGTFPTAETIMYNRCIIILRVNAAL